MGAVRRRPRLGHRPRGLQRRRRRLDLLPARPRPQQGLPLGRGRHRRHLRPLPAPRLRPRLLERPRPDPQGAALRPDPVRGQPRRGRQGVLLLPRQHPDALVHAVPLQVPAGRPPVPPARRGEPRPADHEPEFELLDTGVFDDDRYFDVIIEYAKADPEDICVRITRSTAAPTPRRCTSCRTSGSATPGRWGPDPRPRAAHRAPARGPRGIWLVADDADAEPLPNLPFAYRLGPAHLYAPAGGEPLFTDNETNCRRVFGPRARRAAAATSRTPSTATSSTARPAVNPAGSAPRPASTTGRDDPARRLGVTLRLRLTDRRARPTRWPTSTRSSTSGGAEADEFYDGAPPADGHRRTSSSSSGRPSPGCSGPSRSTCSTSTSGSTATTRRPAAAGPRGRSATSTGGT